MEKERLDDFTKGKIVGKLLYFMLPVLLALILQAMYGAVDILIVGQYGLPTGISGVSTGSTIIAVITFVISGLTMGVTVLISRYKGEGLLDRIPKVIGSSIVFFAILSIVLMGLTIGFARPIAILLQSPAEALDDAVSYIQICGIGLIFIVFYNLISAIFRGLGDSKLPLLFVGIACVINIILDLVFVKVCSLNTVGAALATVIAQAISVIVSLIILLKKKYDFQFSIKDIRFNKEIHIFTRIGAPMAIQEILTEVSFLAIMAFCNALGLDQSSGYGVACRIMGFVMLVPSALMQSLSAIIAQNVGCKKEKRARKIFFIGMGLASIAGLIVAIVTFFFGEQMSFIFTKDPNYAHQSGLFLAGNATEALLTCALFSFIGYFNGHNKTIFVMIQGIAQTFLVRLPLSYFMSVQPDPSLFWIGFAAPCATVFGIIINVIYFIIYNKKYVKNSAE